ncbi:hypothetical protein QAD02_022051 [Eretmocerus hayati]|uniref:Uncharacterized protein n=1 Tax=Eretmocerus hayati TaxID=131215 RepID=A0ACC2PS73_9HYME|nr:hypothetical protein QAD02_022051 [Eretmocerus hayati]
MYTELGLYTDPELHTVASLKSHKLSGTSLCISDEKVTMHELWAEQIKNVDESDIVLPLIGYYDAIQAGNGMGSHATETNIGNVSATIACFPPNFSSRLENMVVSDIFLEKDREQCGNKAIFKAFIEEVCYLRRVGIELNIKSRKVRVKLILNLMTSDNLALNSINGPTSFNDIDEYHVILNACLDLMHDLNEGVCNIVMAKILLLYTCDEEYKRFDINYVDHRMSTLDFGFEQGNIPSKISLEYLKKNQKLRMSASKMMFFTRYFSILVDDDIPRDDKPYPLHLKLREIISILTEPILTDAILSEAKVLIIEHNRLYIELFGKLKPKFHFLLHYDRMMRRNGPAIKNSVMRFESNNRKVKLAIQYSNCHKNTLKGTAIRLQLSNMNSHFKAYEDVYRTDGKDVKDNSLVQLLYPTAQQKEELHSITLDGVTYGKETIIVIDEKDGGFFFAKSESNRLNKSKRSALKFLEKVEFRMRKAEVEVDELEQSREWMKEGIRPAQQSVPKFENKLGALQQRAAEEPLGRRTASSVAVPVKNL